jgi:serine/threonine protein kinase
LRLAAGQLIVSSETRRKFRVGSLLGVGGFGAVYECTSRSLPGELLAMKVTHNQRSWVRELYFSELVGNLRTGVIRILDSFPTVLPGKRGMTAYVIVEDLALGGTLADLLDRSGAMTERWVVSQFKVLLRVLDRLHQQGAVHRDLTPGNVFVDGFDRLLLGDFGIAVHGLRAKGAAASAFNPGFIPPEIRKGGHFWSSEQDVWQVGQLMTMVLQGTPYGLFPHSVRDLDCADWLKEVIYRAIVHDPTERYRHAADMLKAMHGQSTALSRLPGARPWSLEGKRLVFTAAIPGMTKDAAARLARRHKASVSGDVTYGTDYLVVGGTSPTYVAGIAGTKILRALALNERGANIKKLSGLQFARIVGA